MVQRPKLRERESLHSAEMKVALIGPRRIKMKTWSSPPSHTNGNEWLKKLLPLPPFVYESSPLLGISASLIRALASAPVGHAAGSNYACTLDIAVKPLTASVKRIPELLARRKNEDLLGLNIHKKENPKGKFVKREKKTQPPVEAPYVPKLKRFSKSLQEKTVEIFDGMTMVELAKLLTGVINFKPSPLHYLFSRKSSKNRGLVGFNRNCSNNLIMVSLLDLEIEICSLAFSFVMLKVAFGHLMDLMILQEVGASVKRIHANEGTECVPQPPVVTVMGHVDHGKTSLLDALRRTSVAAKEAGGITQHLGVFIVSMPSGASITFLDTPGHAAFSAMRARGAAIMDMVVLVVAAADGEMPQTLEAIAHAKAANVPIVVAVNKCDKPAANPERVKIQLASEGLLPEDMGGDIQAVEVSAIKKTGLEILEEALLLQAEVMNLKACVDGPAQAYVVEARLDKGRGSLATAIVKAGILVCGQHVVVGSEWGRIRAIRDMAGNLTDWATPAMPGEIEV
ncbi:hypothetical protein PTKIN_Ptkin05aG0065300 [Pterospermum kingtungense]